MFKIAFWLGLLVAGVLVGSKVIPVYYDNIKLQNIFEGVTENLLKTSEAKIILRIQDLIDIQGVNRQALPQEFFDHLSVVKNDGKLSVSSAYHVTVWLLGPPEMVDPNKEYAEKDIPPMDKLRLRARLDFDFSPYAETP